MTGPTRCAAYGGRFTYAFASVVEHVYAGAYWEQEYNGRVRSSVNGRKIQTPELKGSTGMGELGMVLRPFAKTGSCGPTLDLAVQGYTGTREGVSGSLRISFEF